MGFLPLRPNSDHLVAANANNRISSLLLEKKPKTTIINLLDDNFPEFKKNFVLSGFYGNCSDLKDSCVKKKLDKKFKKCKIRIKI